MAKNLFHLFHNDGASLSLGSTAALRSSRRASETGVEVEVFCFGSAQKALSGSVEEGPVKTFNENIDELVSSGVRVAACINAAKGTDTVDDLTGRGIILESAVDVFARCAVDGTNVITF
jgi:hypothetical protein